jgi:hypothetical protein
VNAASSLKPNNMNELRVVVVVVVVVVPLSWCDCEQGEVLLQLIFIQHEETLILGGIAFILLQNTTFLVRIH